MKNHTEILDDIASKIDAFKPNGREMEEDLLLPAREVLSELRSILEKIDSPVDTSSNQ